MRHQVGNIGRAGLPIHIENGQQHQHRADKRIEEEFEAGINAPRAAPYADNQEHRDKATFKEQIKEDDVHGAENANHQRLKHQKGQHIFAHARLNGMPAGKNT